MKSFAEKCYTLLKKVQRGKVTTYKAIAEALKTNAYRAVGNAMNRNQSKEVPCHRVVKSNGEIGGFARGVLNKSKLLRKEGIEIIDNKIALEKFIHKF